jgi:hypothetical protein
LYPVPIYKTEVGIVAIGKIKGVLDLATQRNAGMTVVEGAAEVPAYNGELLESFG